jgi:folate-dependent phosphoribosylglycinamide formyltransferase PurN
LNVLVLTSAPMGIELAACLARLDEVRLLTVVTTRTVPRPHSRLEKLRRLLHYDGPPGILRELSGAARRLFGPDRREALARAVAARCPGARHLHRDDLHTAESIALLKGLAPDIGVVFAAYRLRPEVFTIPRLGCINLHLGRAPEFRGSSPAFYELLEGVPEVGVTVHRVSEKLDAGPILAEESFPLDLAPEQDPVSYLVRYQSEILVPNGTRMMTDVVRRLAGGGPIEERAQPPGAAPARGRATYELKRELRRRVRIRRAASRGVVRSD